jgi:hypothetical protein
LRQGIAGVVRQVAVSQDRVSRTAGGTHDRDDGAWRDFGAVERLLNAIWVDSDVAGVVDGNDYLTSSMCQDWTQLTSPSSGGIWRSAQTWRSPCRSWTRGFGEHERE